MTSLIALVLLQTRFNTGASFHYAVSLTYSNTELNESTSIEQDGVYKVLKGTSNGLTDVNCTLRLVKVAINGQTLSDGDVKETTTWVEKRSALGQVFGRPLNKTFPVLLARQARPLDLKFPAEEVKTGDTWRFSVPEDQESGLSAAKWTWTLDKVDDRFAWLKTTFTEVETTNPIVGEGVSKINLQDGWVETVDMRLGPTLVPGDSEKIPVDLHVVWTRK